MRRGRRVFGGVFFLVGGIVAIAVLSLPSGIESLVKRALSTESVRVEAFTIDHIGFRGVALGEALATFEQGHVAWEAAGIGYNWSSLKQAKVESVDIDGLEIAWQGRVPSEVIAPSDAGPEGLPVDAGPILEETSGPEAETVASGSPGELEVRRRSWMALIPFHHFEVRDGRLLLGGDGLPEARIGFAFQARVAADHLETALSLGDGLLEVQAEALSGPVPGGERWISTGKVDAAKAFELVGILNPGALAASGLSALSGGQPIRFDTFSESFPREPSRWSLSVEAADLRLEGPFLGELALRQVMLGGWGVADERHLRLGLALEHFHRGPMSAGPGRFELSLEAADWTVNSESFSFRVGSLAGVAAVRGAGLANPFADSGKARLEAAISELQFPWAALESFSLLVEKAGTQWQVEASPLVHRGKTGISVSQSRFLWQEAIGTGSGTADLLGSDGRPLGRLSVAIEAGHGQPIKAEARFVDARTLNPLTLSGQLAEGAWELAVGGAIPPDGLREALASAGWTDWQIEGDPIVRLEADLRSGALISGEGRITVEGLTMRLGSRATVRDIAGQTPFRVRGWPATEGLQRLRVGSVQMGTLAFTSIEVEWGLPTLQHLRVESITGRLGGGLFAVSPFALSPREPRFSAAVQGQGLPVQLFFDLMKETRFRVEGTVSGEMLTGWDAGALLLGSGRFTLDGGGAPARFVFQDRAFLERTVASLGGIPGTVREPLQEALLEEGIAIETLNLTLGPTEDQSHFTVRLELAGSCANAAIQIPIRGIVIEQRLSVADLSRLFGFQGPRSIRLISATVQD